MQQGTHKSATDNSNCSLVIRPFIPTQNSFISETVSNIPFASPPGVPISANKFISPKQRDGQCSRWMRRVLARVSLCPKAFRLHCDYCLRRGCSRTCRSSRPWLIHDLQEDFARQRFSRLPLPSDIPRESLRIANVSPSSAASLDRPETSAHLHIYFPSFLPPLPLSSRPARRSNGTFRRGYGNFIYAAPCP